MKNLHHSLLISAGLSLGLAVNSAQACDLCALYSADSAIGPYEGAYAGISEQFTRYDQLRENGRKLPDSYNQRLNSSITQLLLGYGFSQRWNVQLSAPYIVRDYRRPGDAGAEKGSETGFGDVSLTSQYTVYRLRTGQAALSWRVLAGLKLPTGDSRRLAEELGVEAAPAAGAPVSGIHGHDLVLGSGSVDGIFGTSLAARTGRWIARGEAQYAARSEGDHHYRVGDDFQWNLGGGRYLCVADGQTIAALVNVSGEYKKLDQLNGEAAGDTQSRLLSLGAEAQATLGERWSADLRADFPIENYGSAVQTTQRYRLRLALIRAF